MTDYNPQWDKLKQLQRQDPGTPSSAAGSRPGGDAPRPTAPRPAGGGYGQTPRPVLPQGYLSGGYFNSDGYLKKELLVDHAREVARVIGQGYDGIKNAQLRRFYGHVRAADTRMMHGASFEAVQPSIFELSAFVAEAQGKKKVPLAFKEFMDKNLEHVRDAKSFRKGFVEHFQAVVGFFSSFGYRE